MTKNKDFAALLISLLVTLGTAVVLVAWMQETFLRNRAAQEGEDWSQPGAELPSDLTDLSQRLSGGDRQLIADVSTPAKQEGIAAFADGEYLKAIEWFEVSLKLLPNDPETRIYLNNARLWATGQPRYGIAVSVPIGKNLNIAQEILRGVAQAQDEVNQQGGIDQAGLEVIIANDDNRADVTRKLAERLVRDERLLAVVGHNTSDASLAAAPIYERQGLLMISPTTFDPDVARVGRFIFRAVPTPQAMVAPLVDNILARSPQPRLLVCYDAEAPDNNQFRNAFVDALTARGGEIVKVTNEQGEDLCNFASGSFDAAAAIARAREQAATGIYLGPSINNLDPAIAVARANGGQLPLFSSPSLYTQKILQDGKTAVDGLVLPTPWSPEVYPDFARRAQRLWQATVNWRTATAYDATQALIEGLRQSDSRSGLQQALQSSDFGAIGATDEPVRFLDTGDRRLSPVLVQVQPDKKGSYRFKALPIPR